MMICKVCQSEIIEDSIYCPYCGFQIFPEGYIFPKKNEEYIIQKEKEKKQTLVRILEFISTMIFWGFSAFIFLSGKIFEIKGTQIHSIFRIYPALQPFFVTSGIVYLIIGALTITSYLYECKNKKICHSINRVIIWGSAGVLVIYITVSFIILHSLIITKLSALHITYYIIVIVMLIIKNIVPQKL